MSKSYCITANADVWITNPQTFRLHHYYFKNFLVEDIGVEPMTPSLQS